MLRHRLPRRAARRPRAPTRCPPPGASAGRCGATASTASRTPGRRAARGPGPGGHLPPRRGRVAGRRPRRALRRHHDGLHAARGPGDGHALGQRRPRPAAVAARAHRHDRARARRGAGARVGAEGPGRDGATCARCWRRRPAASRRRRSRSTSTSTACGPAIAAMAAALGGLDALVFTGGVGERAPEVRAGAAEGLGFLGVAVDAERNAAGAEEIGAGGARACSWSRPARTSRSLAGSAPRSARRQARHLGA